MCLTEVNSATPDLAVQDYDVATAQYAVIHADCVEMAQLKSNFDIEQFTLNSQGPFAAHQFHFLMRQYSLALLELRRLYNEYDRVVKKLTWLESDDVADDPQNGFFAANEAVECELQLDQLELSIVNKRRMCARFELCRKQLVQEHGNRAFTNAEYQQEEPAYWKYMFEKMMQHHRLQAQTGIPEGVWKNLRAAASRPLLESQHQLQLGGDGEIKCLPAPTDGDIWDTW